MPPGTASVGLSAGIDRTVSYRSAVERRVVYRHPTRNFLGFRYSGAVAQETRSISQDRKSPSDLHLGPSNEILLRRSTPATANTLGFAQALNTLGTPRSDPPPVNSCANSNQDRRHHFVSDVNASTPTDGWYLRSDRGLPPGRLEHTAVPHQDHRGFPSTGQARASCSTVCPSSGNPAATGRTASKRRSTRPSTNEQTGR